MKVSGWVTLKQHHGWKSKDQCKQYEWKSKKEGQSRQHRGWKSKYEGQSKQQHG